MLHHIAVPVPTGLLGACRAFYATLGFSEVPPPDSLAGRAVWLQRGRTQVHLMIVADDEGAKPSAGHLAVVAPDYERTVRALRAAGHEVDARRAHWGAARAFVLDPAGHRVEIMAYPPGVGS